MVVGSEAADDFLIGDAVVSITLHPFEVEFLFTRDRVTIGGNFTLSRDGQSDELFTPAKKMGRLDALWPLIGCLVTQIRWQAGVCIDKDIEIIFDDATLLKILPSIHFRGTIIGRNPPPGFFQMEDF